MLSAVFTAATCFNSKGSSSDQKPLKYIKMCVHCFTTVYTHFVPFFIVFGQNIVPRCILTKTFHTYPNIVRVIKSRRMRWAGHVACMGEERGVYMVLVGKPEGKRPLGRPRCRWVDNIRTDLQEVRCGYVDWIGVAQDRDRWRKLVSAVMNLRVP